MRKWFPFGVLILAIGTLAFGKDGETPSGVNEVSSTIDRLIGDRLKAEKITPSPRADDAEFLRRVTLDLTGTIPTAEQTKAFLDSTDPNKRAKLIDDLLAGAAYGRHLGTIWRDLIVRPDANMIRPPNTTPLVDWLANQFNRGCGWDKIVSDLLTVEGDKPESLFFILNGDTRGYPQANIVAGTVGQLFMGTQLACAECHHHPFVETWKQEDFWGVAAFFGKVQNGGGAKGGKAASTAIHETTADVKDKKRNMAPKIGPGTSIVIPDTSFKQIGKTVKARLPHGEAPAMARDKPFRPTFAKWLTSKENPYFAANAVNRMWGHLFGTAFANPVGEVSEINPHSHPELVAYLSREFANHGFDVRFLIKAICNTEAYQRTSRPIPGNADAEDPLFARQGVKVLTPEVLYSSLTTALDVPSLSVKAAALAAKTPNTKAAVKKAAAKAKNTPPMGKEQFLQFYATKEVEGNATEYSHGIPQALRLMNQDLFNTGGNTLTRAMKLGTPAKVIESLYLSVLSRRPTETEAKEAAEYVTKAKTAEEGYRGVFWALINGAEFILNR